MHERRVTIGLMAALLWIAQSPAATVYKWIDANGVVHFSDQPAPGAQRIVTQPGELPHFSAPPTAPAAPVRPPDAAPAETALGYSTFEIDAPKPEQTFNSSAVSAHIHLVPTLKPKHSVVLFLDGKALRDQPPGAMQFELGELPRGTHTLTATITDAVSGDSQSSPPVTFYVHEPSILSPKSPLKPKN